MNEHVRLEVTCRGRGVVAEVTLEALLTLVRLEVCLELVTIGKGLVAALAGQHLVARVQLLHVNAEISLTAAGGGAKFALEKKIQKISTTFTIRKQILLP